MPTVDVVSGKAGEALWRVCGWGMCVIESSRQRADARLADLCRAKGISQDQLNTHPQPDAGPSGSQRGLRLRNE